MKNIFRFIFRNFLQGLAIIAPIAVTYYIILSVFEALDSMIPFLAKYGYGISAVATLGIILVVGYLGTRFIIGRWLVQLFDSILERIPGVKFLYTSLKDIVISFVGDKKKFTDPVWVKVNEQPEILRIGFVTHLSLQIAEKEEKVAVYMPHAYAISGWVIVVDKDLIIPITNMTPAEAMKFAVSGGVTS
jgi:uncharacterized membrane protein